MLVETICLTGKNRATLIFVETIHFSGKNRATLRFCHRDYGGSVMFDGHVFCVVSVLLWSEKREEKRLQHLSSKNPKNNEKKHLLLYILSSNNPKKNQQKPPH